MQRLMLIRQRGGGTSKPVNAAILCAGLQNQSRIAFEVLSEERNMGNI